MLYNDALHERKDAYRSAASRGIVALVQVRLPPIQFFLDKVVPVQEIGGLEKQRSKPPASPSLPAPHPGCRSTVRAGEAATLFGQNAKVGIGGGTLGDSGAQGVAVLPCPMLLRTK